ncbi:MAG: alkane 1-monooxygenase, partial [Paracoccaceae bacterium]
MVSRANLFVIATLLPVPLLALGAWTGGLWLLAALVYLSVFAFALDELVAVAQPQNEPAREFPAADGLSVLLALAHFVLLGLAVFALSGRSGLGPGDRLIGFFAFGLFFGQVSNSNAHELIHRSGRVLHGLGKWVFISHLFGHHTSAHRFVHHRDVATPDDPNSARLGQSFYHFAPRAWIGSFRRGLEAENQRRGAATGLHPYAVYLGGALGVLVLAAVIGGAAGVVALVGLAAYATMQLLLSDYVQHYGLRRARGPDGRYEPVAARHSWNSPHVFSALVMLNAPRHSDHHA